MSTGFDHGGPRRGRYRGSTALFLVIAALAWAILIILAAMTVPIVTVAAAPVTATATAPPTLGTTPTPTSTPNGQQLYESPRVSVLTHDGGAGVAVAGIPAATSLLVGGLLWVGAGRRRTVLVPITAWTLSSALLAAGIVGFLTFLIGIVAVPTGVLLVLACSQAAPLRPRTVPAGAGRS